MKNKYFFQRLLVLLLFGLFIFSCYENEPTADSLSWSPDGQKLLMITNQSQELLLIRVSENNVSQVSVVDSARQEKPAFFAPRWSSDSKYFLYIKLQQRLCHLFIDAITEKGYTLSTCLTSEAPEKSTASIINACWAPQQNLILFHEIDKSKKRQLVTVDVYGKNRRVLKTGRSDVVSFQWSPDGSCIAYLAIGDTKNSTGLWLVNADGSTARQIYQGEGISQFQWAPDGATIVFIQKSGLEQNVGYNIFLIDAQGKHLQLISENKTEISQVDWSPDGTMMAYLQQAEKGKNLWLIEQKTRQKTKLTFDNVENYFGWQKPNKLIFSIKYPETIVELPEAEKEKNDVHEIIHGISKKNIVISYQNHQFSKLGKNMLYPNFNPVFSVLAYFDICKTPELLGSELYLPIVQFSSGNTEYLARTNNELIAAADKHVLKKEWAKACARLSDYFAFDLCQAKFLPYFDADSIIAAKISGRDSLRVSQVFDAVKNGTLSKTIYILNKLNEKEKADWLFEQLIKLTSNYVKDNLSNQDELYWNIIAAYGKYHEVELGINDLDRMLLAADGDSLFLSYLAFSQAFLAFENNDAKLCLEKLNLSSQIMPAQHDELEPFNFLISTCSKNISYENNPAIKTTLERLRQRFPKSRDVYQTLNLLGDYYAKLGEKNKAISLYQQAILKTPEDQELWQKLFDLQR